MLIQGEALDAWEILFVLLDAFASCYFGINYTYLLHIKTRESGNRGGYKLFRKNSYKKQKIKNKVFASYQDLMIIKEKLQCH